MFQVLNAYLNELQNRNRRYHPLQITLNFRRDTSCAVELENSEGKRESCTNSTDLQDTELAVVDEVVGRQQEIKM